MQACKRWLVCAVLLAAAFPVRAEDLAPGRVLRLEGQRGMWWPLETADTLRAEHLEVLELRALVLEHENLIGNLRRQLAEKELRLKNQALAGGLSEARALVAEEAIASAVRGQHAAEARAIEAEARTRAWYRHPALWFAFGSVVTAGVVGAGFAAAN